jgi:hypothetical protein
MLLRNINNLLGAKLHDNISQTAKKKIVTAVNAESGTFISPIFITLNYLWHFTNRRNVSVTTEV